VGDKRWVHIDLAGPSYVEKPVDSHVPKGGSGFGVLTLLQYVASRYGA
jgi:leucyl aminopeptidase